MSRLEINYLDNCLTPNYSALDVDIRDVVWARLTLCKGRSRPTLLSSALQTIYDINEIRQLLSFSTSPQYSRRLMNFPNPEYKRLVAEKFGECFSKIVARDIVDIPILFRTIDFEGTFNIQYQNNKPKKPDFIGRRNISNRYSAIEAKGSTGKLKNRTLINGLEQVASPISIENQTPELGVVCYTHLENSNSRNICCSIADPVSDKMPAWYFKPTARMWQNYYFGAWFWSDARVILEEPFLSEFAITLRPELKERLPILYGERNFWREFAIIAQKLSKDGWHNEESTGKSKRFPDGIEIEHLFWE